MVREQFRNLKSQNRMDTKTSGEVTHPLNRILAALAHDVGRAELFSECDSVGMPAEDDDLLGG